MVLASTNFGGYFMEQWILYYYLPVVRVRYFNLIVSTTTISPICINTSTTFLQVQLWPLRSHLQSTSHLRRCGSWYCSSISFSLWCSTPSFMPNVYQSTTVSSSLERFFSVSVSTCEINFSEANHFLTVKMQTWRWMQREKLNSQKTRTVVRVIMV